MQAVQDALDKIGRFRIIHTKVEQLTEERHSQITKEPLGTDLSQVNLENKYHIAPDKEGRGFDIAFPDPNDPEQRHIVSTHGIEDLEETLARCDKMIQLYEENDRYFLPDHHIPIIPEHFIVSGTMGECFNPRLVYLAFVDNGSKLAIHYLDQRDKKVKMHEIDTIQPIESIMDEISRFRSQFYGIVEDSQKQVEKQFASKIIKNPPEETSNQDLKDNKDFRIIVNSEPAFFDDMISFNLGYRVVFYHPELNSIVAERTEGVSPEAVQETIDKIRRIHQSFDLIKAYQSQPGAIPVKASKTGEKVTLESFSELEENGIIVQPSTDYRSFIAYFRNPSNPSAICQIREPVKDISLVLSHVQEQKEEMRNFTMTESAFTQNAASSAVEIPRPVRGAKPDALMQMFKRIEWKDKSKPGYRDPTTLTNDGYHTTKESLEADLFLLIDHITHRKDRYGVPSSNHPEEKEKYYQNLYALLSNIVSKLRKEENPDTRNGYVLNIAEGGAHCGGRWMSEAAQIFNLLTNAEKLTASSEANIEQMILGWLDGLKIGTVEEMVMEGGNVQTSHEYLMYCRALKEENVMIPSASAADYRDPFEASGLEGKYTTKEAIVNGFKGKFNTKRCIDLILGNLNDKLKSTQGKIASGAMEVLEDYTEKVVLDLPEHREKKEQLKTIQAEYIKRIQEINEAKELNDKELDKTIENGLKLLPELAEKAKAGKLNRTPLKDLPSFKAEQMEIIYQTAEKLGESLKYNEDLYNKRVEKYKTSPKLQTEEERKSKMEEAKTRFDDATKSDIQDAQKKIPQLKTMRKDEVAKSTNQMKQKRAQIMDPVVEAQKFFVMDKSDTPVAFTRNGARALLEYFGKINSKRATEEEHT